MKHYKSIEELKKDCATGEYGVSVIAIPIYSEDDGALLYYIKYYL